MSSVELGAGTQPVEEAQRTDGLPGMNGFQRHEFWNSHQTVRVWSINMATSLSRLVSQSAGENGEAHKSS